MNPPDDDPELQVPADRLEHAFERFVREQDRLMNEARAGRQASALRCSARN